MKKSLFIALMVAVAFAATSCSTTFKSIQEPLVHFQLNSNDYVLSDQVTGEASVVRVLNIDWARIFTNKFGTVATPIFGATSTVTFDQMYAVYDLLEKHPGYDFVMYPQFTTVSEGVQGIFVKNTVKVTARLGKMKK